MKSLIRSLAPVLAVVLVLAAALVAWIRVQPLAMPRETQSALSLALVVLIGGLLALVARSETRVG